ncbi:hypothetical protein GGI10_000925 [Coemansia sp. RSA 2530]|nr:hypothetical protein GGI10_000925 [Coemansia sp. RSA 2530]
MLAHPRKAKEHGGRAEGRSLDLVDVTTMSSDLPAESASRAALDRQQQQQRRPAALYLPARSPPYGLPNNDSCLVSSSDSTATPKMPSTNTLLDLPASNRPQNSPRPALRRDPPLPHTLPLPPIPPHARTSSISRASTATDDDALSVVGTESQGSKITHEEELYLRRVSVLYHELWTSDWVDRQLFGTEPLEESAIGHDSTATLDDGDAYDGATKDEPPMTACEEPASAALYSDYDSIADLEGADFVSTTPQTTPQTIARLDNDANPGTNIPNGLADPSQNCSEQQHKHSRDFSGDSARAEVAEAADPCPVEDIDRAPAPSFSSSDLVDALVGTVHRLEDDHTLVQHKRWSVVKELAITEAHYLRDLLLLRAVFYEPLAGSSGSGLLRSEDALVIFGNLDHVIDCARSLVEYLTVAVVYEANRCCALGDDVSQAAIVGSEHAASAASETILPALEPPVQAQWRSLSRPASQPEATHLVADAHPGDSGLRSSAWADISIARSFLLASQRMERTYAQYCRNFEAASQRLVEIKQLSASISASAAAPGTTVPSTPLTMYRLSSTSSPLTDGSKGRRQPHGGNSSGNSRSGIHSSGSDHRNMSIQLDLGDPDAMYSAVVYQFMCEQSQLLAGKTTSWDLPSLLIKPVQRILKYPLLIKSLLGLTRQHTSDSSQLEKASQSIERIAETINSVSNINGLRISTATTASATLAASDESQSRIARELRRVLRRRPGNVGHMRTKSISEQPAKDRFWVPSRPKSRAKDTPELPGVGGPVSGPPANGIEALIGQHELRLSELIRSLRRWESDLGSMLRQQVALVARWKDFYDLPCKELDPVVVPEGYVDLLAPDCDSRSSDEMVDICTVESARPGTGRQFPYSSFERLQTRMDPRHSKSHGALRAHSDRALPTRRASAVRQSTEPHMILAAEIRKSISSTISDKESGEGAWRMHKRDGVVRYHAALETVFTTLYPQCICYPLHSRVYPVLNSLLQIYSDGPRSILSEIARLSSSSNLPAFSAAEQGSERVSRLQGALASDLPRLFEHERTVVRLLLEQIVTIERDFYRHTLDSLAKAYAQSCDNASPLLLPNESDSRLSGGTLDMDTCVAASPSNREVAPITLSPPNPLGSSRVHPQLPESSMWGARIRLAYERRVCERTVRDSGPPLPSANECIGNIQASLWLLVQDSVVNGSTPLAVKARRRRSSTEPAAAAGRSSAQLVAADGQLVASGFESTAPKFGSAWHGPVSDEPVPAIPDRRNADEVQPFGTGMWHHVEILTTASADTTSRPIMSKHSRKKSIGIIERITHLRPGRTSRSPLVFATGSGDEGPPYYDNADQVKSRARLGLAIDVPTAAPTNGGFASDDAFTRPSSAASHCAPSSAASLYGSSNSGWPGSSAAKFEPLPVVDSIRFSKGFIDSTFDILGSRESPEGGSATATAEASAEDGS